MIKKNMANKNDCSILDNNKFIENEQDLNDLRCNGVSRRNFLGGLSTVAAMFPFQNSPAYGQASSVLPLNTPGLDHLDIIVPDVEASAKFYMSVFSTRLHAQPFRGGQRYFVLLGELKEGRQVSYVAIGESQGRGTYIGHFCTSVYDYFRDRENIFSSMSESISREGFNTFPGSTGVGGIFADPDGIEIQFLPAPDTLVTAAVPSDLVTPEQGIVVPLGVDHVLLRVSNLQKARQYYTILYGDEIVRVDDTGRVFFEFENSQLILEQADYAYGQTIGIAHFCIRVASFEQQVVAAELSALGAEILSSDDEPGVLRFRDLDGITVELRAV